METKWKCSQKYERHLLGWLHLLMKFDYCTTASQLGGEERETFAATITLEVADFDSAVGVADFARWKRKSGIFTLKTIGADRKSVV